MDDAACDTLVDLVHENQHSISLFCDQVRNFFLTHPNLNEGPLPTIHSVKSRVKDLGHLRDKP
jgi:hypothetical protein